MCSCVQMSQFLDLAEFGEAARFLRLTNLEQLAAVAQAYDGIYTCIYTSIYVGLLYTACVHKVNKKMV